MAEHFVVVGGTTGSGRTLVRLVLDRGDQATVLGRHASPEVQQQLPGLHFYQVDLCDLESVRTAMDQAAQRSGKLSHLVFFQRYRGKGDAWEGELQVSLTATKFLMELCQDRFDGTAANSIVVVSSVAGRFVLVEQPVSYHMAKAALVQMARYYAASLGPRGIRVNVVSPDALIKDESRKFYEENRKLTDLYKTITPLGRMGTSEDVAAVVDFLCSSRASFMTGQELVVDGGLSLVGQAALARRVADLGDLKITR